MSNRVKSSFLLLLALTASACGQDKATHTVREKSSQELENVNNGTRNARPIYSSKTRPLSVLPEDFVYGEWILSSIKSGNTRDDDPDWIGAQLKLSKTSIRLTPKTGPVFSHQHDFTISTTCTQPKYYSDFHENYKTEASNYLEVYNRFGLPPLEGRRLYAVECNPLLPVGAEMSEEEVLGPKYIYPYAVDVIIIVWSPDFVALFRRNE